METIFYKYFDLLKKEIEQNYISQNRKASGEFQKALEIKTNPKGAKLLGAKHSYFVQHGRKAGRRPPTEIIEDWIEVKKGLPPIFHQKKKQFAFLIARKIGKQGTKGTDVMEQPISDFLKSKVIELLQEVGADKIEKLKSDIIHFLNNRK